MGRIHFYVWKWMINKANITCDPTYWNGFVNFHSVLVILYFPNFGWKFYKLIKEKGTKMFPWLLFLLLKTFISPGISSCNYFERFPFWFILFCKEELLWLLANFPWLIANYIIESLEHKVNRLDIMNIMHESAKNRCCLSLMISSIVMSFYDLFYQNDWNRPMYEHLFDIFLVIFLMHLYNA